MSQSSSRTTVGRCLCGAISWQVEGDFSLLSNCHCSMCRKVHGTAFGTYAAAPAVAFRWLSGADLVASYVSSPGSRRPFCPRCGSSVASVAGDLAFMPAGCMDGDIGRPLDNHIFVASRAPWYTITDGAPQHDAYPAGYAVQPTEQPPRPPHTPGATGGSCLCNAVRYEFDGTSQRMGYCHCSRCRRARGSAHSAQLFVPLGNFRWLAGEALVRTFKLPEATAFTTTFCPDCGSPVPQVLADMGMVMLPAGSLDQDPGVRPMAHIYVGSKAPWFEITDDLPRFEAMPPA